MKRNFSQYLKTLTASILMIGATFSNFTHAEDDQLSFEETRLMIHGPNYLEPSRESLIGQYLSETKAKITIRKFWRADEGSIMPPHVLGPERLIVPVSEKTFATFKKYFGSWHFLFLLNRHGNWAAFEGKQSHNNTVGAHVDTNWTGHILDSDFSFPGAGSIAAAMILDSKEGQRARDFFELALLKPDLARHPWGLVSEKSKKKKYTVKGVWSDSCATWIGNMPIGDDVEEYFQASGDPDGMTPLHEPLLAYKDPDGLNDHERELLHKVWSVPGHQQLSEILDPGANRRGDFDNAGWTSYTFLGSASAERVPVVFYFTNNVKDELKPDFYYQIDTRFMNQ